MPVRPSAALAAAYRKRLTRLVDEMARSVAHWVAAAYRANEPELLAQDESPARGLSETVRRLRSRWERRFTRLSSDLARYFATSALKRTDAGLKASLKRGGLTVQLKLTRPLNDVLQASIAENVSLIRSIPAQYFTQVEGAVMRSVQAGRDLASLSNELQRQHGVTKRRAALIARDQNNKATATLTHARYRDLGITHARWLHSAGGKEPRPTHLKASREGTVYKISEGWYDPDPAVKQHVWPGTLINCRCVAVPVLEEVA